MWNQREVRKSFISSRLAMLILFDSGKTSILLSLLHIIEYTSGTIEIDDQDLATISRHEIRRRINVIPQEPLAMRGSVRYNLDVSGKHSDGVLICALEKVEMWQQLQARGGLSADLDLLTLSAGQRQLFCLARATLRQCKIVILDEISSK
jgi:ATP-binding cassette subfamily C (CFTR/MRP) protein 1